MTTFVSFVLIASALIFVGWPFMNTPDDSADDGGESIPPLERQKLDAYAAIKEAEFDLRMGKLSEPDFKALTQRYRQQALAAIAALEKARPRGPAGDEKAGQRFKFCPDCGQRITGGVKFCGGCGRSLQVAAA